eukprot:734386-Pleurochrysis_carterae.AAC.1
MRLPNPHLQIEQRAEESENLVQRAHAVRRRARSGSCVQSTKHEIMQNKRKGLRSVRTGRRSDGKMAQPYAQSG